jgi:hypothetical protein
VETLDEFKYDGHESLFIELLRSYGVLPASWLMSHPLSGLLPIAERCWVISRHMSPQALSKDIRVL